MTAPTAEESRALLEPLSGHTPGPWVQTNQPGYWGLPGAHFVLDAAGQTQVAMVEYITPYCAGASRKDRDDAALADSNARLMAAAPDLAAVRERASMTSREAMRLAFRVEGDFWNAYLAPMAGMEGAIFIGSLHMRLAIETYFDATAVTDVEKYAEEIRNGIEGE